MKKIITAAIALSSVSAFADPVNYLQITSYESLVGNHQTLDTPKTFKVDLDFVKKNNTEFYVFLDRPETVNVCFVGSPALALKVIDAILEVPTGDAYVNPKQSTVNAKQVSRDFTIEDESGDNFATASVSKCP